MVLFLTTVKPTQKGEYHFSCIPDIDGIQQSRRHLVEEMCAAPEVEEVPPADLHHILVGDDRQILVCFLPKCANTNWKSVLLHTSRLYQKVHPYRTISDITHAMEHRVSYRQKYGLKVLSDYTSEEIHFRIWKYFKFMFARHPLQRLLSAYRDKFIMHSKCLV